ncbi:MAG TPA: hypothetical protein DCS35_14085 [Vibrio sp.]|nr:hypothetical protein [Vibrio sp.]
MHAQSLRTIWLVLLTSLMLIASSLASAKTLMPIQMLQASQSVSAHCPSSNTVASMPSQMQTHHQMMTSQPNSSEFNCTSDGDLQHDCCDTTCITVVATLLNQSSPLAQTSGSFSYPITATRDVVKISNDLYRPPTV